MYPNYGFNSDWSQFGIIKSLKDIAKTRYFDEAISMDFSKIIFETLTIFDFEEIPSNWWHFGKNDAGAAIEEK